MKLVRSASEAEVIAEFLRSEYHQKEYHHDRAEFESLVLAGDLNDEKQNAIRRELLFRRHRVTWNELPNDVCWSLAQLDVEDIDKLRIFPRGHWPKMAAGATLTVAGMMESIRNRRFCVSTTEDVCAIHALAYRMKQVGDASSILIIGIDVDNPLTILEGNHRVLAAALHAPDRVCSFRTYLGLSSKMDTCYWYKTNNRIFVRHAWRRIRNLQPRFIKAMKNLTMPLFSE